MADIEDLVAGDHPEQDPPTALQHPYAADQGTLTKWLVDHTAGATPYEVLAVLTATNVKFAGVATQVAAAQAENATALLKELAEDVLAAEPLEVFLTVTVPDGGKAMVVTVSRLSRYRPELGQVSTWTGKVFGFLGEVEEGQLPPLMKLPDAMSLRQAMEPQQITVPTWAEWNAHYGVGANRVMVEGEDLLLSVAEGEAGRTVWVPRLQYLPRAWAPYFMAAMTPEQAMRLMRQLINGLTTEVQRETVTVLERWCAAACTRSGPIGTPRARIKLHISWASPALAMDRSLSRWGARKMAPFTKVLAPVVPAAAALGVAVGAAPPPAGPMPGYFEPSKEKIFSPGEQERIRLACGLVPANYEPGRPAIYAAMLAEGRSLPKIEAVLQQFLAPAPTDWDPIRMYVSAELVRDMKDLKFGWGNENTYDTCHRGISPFAVLQISMEQQTKRRKIQERADRATHLSTEDVRTLEGDPGCCPSSYYNMLNLVRRYIRLLTVLFGNRCGHLLEVQAVFQVLSDKSAIYESMSAELVAETLWQIFIDAREYFSHHGPVLPESTLFALRDSIKNCTVKARINCPINQLLGRLPPSAAVVSMAGGGNSRGSRGSSGASMSTMTHPTEGSGPAVVGGRRTNPSPVVPIVSIMTAFREARPGVDMISLMRARSLSMADIGIGGRGQCLDFMYFGYCERPGCSYSHEPARVSPGKQRDIVRKMTTAIAAYLAATAPAAPG